MFGKVKKYRLFFLGLVFFVFGAGALLFSLSSYSVKEANAAGAYASKYVVASWRQVKLYYTGQELNFSTNYLTIGPASWTITGSVGNNADACSAGETCFTETWAVSGWDEGMSFYDPNVLLRFQNSASKSSTTMVNDNGVGGGDANLAVRVYGTGLYGGLAIDERLSSLNKNDMTGIHSWPTTWTVTGTVN